MGLRERILAEIEGRKVQVLELEKIKRLRLGPGDRFNGIAQPIYIDDKIQSFLRPDITDRTAEDFDSLNIIFEFVEKGALGFVTGNVEDRQTYRYEIKGLMPEIGDLGIVFTAEAVDACRADKVFYTKREIVQPVVQDKPTVHDAFSPIPSTLYVPPYPSEWRLTQEDKRSLWKSSREFGSSMEYPVLVCSY
ncbi:MAG: hypothetical protein KJ601_06455 [Nanoarchaeota archaeon]|nr:hypothetical protein [Nanoarchaeota archaeon]MBU1704310.1 hypothetical protein [Nanoarchaeota archaeon]